MVSTQNEVESGWKLRRSWREACVGADVAFAKGKVPPVTGARSRNAYARYERGEAVPSIDTLERLLEAVRPGGDFVIRDSHR